VSRWHWRQPQREKQPTKGPIVRPMVLTRPTHDVSLAACTVLEDNGFAPK
jgi:hypothetical protein